MISLFTSSGGKFYVTVALAVPPLSMKNRDVRLIGHVRLIGQYGISIPNQGMTHHIKEATYRIFPIKGLTRDKHDRITLTFCLLW